MAPKVFLTGATGYIGGSAHAHVAKAHPDWEFTLLVRDENRAKPIKDNFPKTHFIYGGLSDADVVQKAVAEADIVIHTADSSDNVDGATNIAKGLAAGHSPENPAYWLHVSGTNILTWYDNDNDRAGEPPLDKETYHDIRDVDRIVNLPDHASHRNVDIIVQNAASDSIRPAILCPPMIYGKGTGVVNTRSIQIPDLAKGALEKGFAPIVGQGKTEWHYVHVQDLSEVFLLLADATQDSSKASDPEIFGPKAYYFVEDGAFLWADIAKKIAEVASKQGYLPEPLTKSVTQKEATLMEGVATTTYGQNAKGIAERAKKYLGWKAKEPLPLETIEEVVAIEAKSLGLTPKEKTA